MKMCPVCRTVPFSPADGFCYKEGVKLIEAPTCRSCGRDYVPDVEAFCARCGEQLSGREEMINANQ